MNADRALRAEATLRQHVYAMQPHGYQLQGTDVTDLLADLLHYCKATHIDFAAMLAIAQEIFDDEVKQDP